MIQYGAGSNHSHHYVTRVINLGIRDNEPRAYATVALHDRLTTNTTQTTA